MKSRFQQIAPSDHFSGWHAEYMFVYERLFRTLANEPGNVAEIGCDSGGGILSYAHWFEQNSTEDREYLSIDISPRPGSLDANPSIKHFQGDAYAPSGWHMVSKHGPFACLIDDGSHTLEHQKTFCREYPEMLTENGIAIVEDIQNIEHIPILAAALPHGFFGFGVDIRHTGRYDNLLFAIQRT